TAFTSSSVGGRPTRMFFTLATYTAGVTGSKGTPASFVLASDAAVPPPSTWLDVPPVPLPVRARGFDAESELHPGLGTTAASNPAEAAPTAAARVRRNAKGSAYQSARAFAPSSALICPSNAAPRKRVNAFRELPLRAHSAQMKFRSGPRGVWPRHRR